MAGSAISRMPPKAVAGWFVAGTDGQLWGVITIAYFRPGAVLQRLPASDCFGPESGGAIVQFCNYQRSLRLRHQLGQLINADRRFCKPLQCKYFLGQPFGNTCNLFCFSG